MGKKLDVAATVAGMAGLLTGQKMLGLGLFAKGVTGLEKAYREEHPELEPGWKARWDKAITFYNDTHSEPTNRTLHRIGIPMIVGGALGLLVLPSYRPLWFLSSASFATGWALNIVGHAVFEKNKPAFTDDPLSFIAGPIWDLQQGEASLRVVDGKSKAV